jgi:homoserine dehydrogenase
LGADRKTISPVKRKKFKARPPNLNRMGGLFIQNHSITFIGREEFFIMNQPVQISVVILGLGKVGRELLAQILDNREQLLRRKNISLAVAGIRDSHGYVFQPDGLPDEFLRSILSLKKNHGSIASLPENIPFHLPPAGTILVDTTASDHTSALLAEALDSGCGIVLANKKPLAARWEESRKFFSHPLARWEATVGAGLPVISTLNYLQNTGDSVVSIEGCLSGTLGFLCSQLESGIPYSQAVSSALEMGYTEPDPRDDLSGRDVARKILILARTAGYALEPEDIQIEALYSDHLAGVSIDEFLQRSAEENETYAARLKAACENGQVLRYVARVGAQGGSASLSGVCSDSLPAALRGPESYITFSTDRYQPAPLVVTGPGAGPAVTAAAVYEDVLGLVHQFQFLGDLVVIPSMYKSEPAWR